MERNKRLSTSCSEDTWNVNIEKKMHINGVLDLNTMTNERSVIMVMSLLRMKTLH